MSAELQTRSSADSNIYAVIRNASAAVWNGTAFVTFIDANFATYDVALAEQGTSSGYYVADFPTGITNAGSYGIEFFQRAGGSPSLSDTFVAGGVLHWDGTAEVDEEAAIVLASLAYVKAYNSITTSSADDYLLARIAGVSAAIERYTRRSFLLTDYDEYMDGPGSFTLMLPHYPVTTLTQITLDAYSNSPEVVEGNQYIVDKKTGFVHRKPTSTACPYFASGFQNIKAEYTAGYASIPADVQEVVAQMVGNLYRTRGRDVTVSSEKLGDYQVTYKYDAMITDGIKSTLDRYRDQIV